MECVPWLSVLLLHCALRVLPEPTSATPAQSEVSPSVKLTLPVGLLPVTLAVNVTFAPTVEGLTELASAVVVGGRPATLTVTLSAVAVALLTVMLTLYVLSVYVWPTGSAASKKLPAVPGVMSRISVSSAKQPGGLQG